MTGTARIRTLTVGTPIEFRLGDPDWITPYRGRIVEVLWQGGHDVLVHLAPLTPEELAHTGGGNFRSQVRLHKDTDVTVLDLPGATDVPATKTMIARPRVPIRRLDDGRHRAECAHCDWTITSRSTVRAEIADEARYHRAQHRLGDLEVTR